MKTYMTLFTSLTCTFFNGKFPLRFVGLFVPVVVATVTVNLLPEGRKGRYGSGCGFSRLAYAIHHYLSLQSAIIFIKLNAKTCLVKYLSKPLKY